MGDKTAIEWTDATWNPVTGCTKVSTGCKNCYAEAAFPRTAAGQTVPDGYKQAGFCGKRPVTRPRRFTDVRCHPERLDKPLRWRKPRRVFVNSMSDLFHEAVPDKFIDQVFATMALAPRHTFQVLTKRPERMRALLFVSQLRIQATTERLFYSKRDDEDDPPRPKWPLPNVWLGVSCEDQLTADDRIPILLHTPAAKRFVSLEPLLGPIDLTGGKHRRLDPPPKPRYLVSPRDRKQSLATGASFYLGKPVGLDWVIVGGESGPKARPCDVAWIRSIVEQGKTAGVPYFVKQLGARPVVFGEGWGELSDRKGGNPAEWPEDLRVQEMPT